MKKAAISLTEVSNDYRLISMAVTYPIPGIFVFYLPEQS
jgi:hypothetical protein